MVVRVEGGAQDGVGKAMLGGTVSILKGTNRDGKRVNGSVGKSFAYGAQRGPAVRPGLGRLALLHPALGRRRRARRRARGADRRLTRLSLDRANAKGFAFEYMTSGRAIVLGDIGPWACAGMTGGRVYVRVNPEWNLDREAIAARLGEGAKVTLAELDPEGMLDVQDLLGHYADELRATDQDAEAERMMALADGRPTRAS